LEDGGPGSVCVCFGNRLLKWRLARRQPSDVSGSKGESSSSLISKV